MQNNLTPTDSTRTHYHYFSRTILYNFLSISLPLWWVWTGQSGWLILYVFSCKVESIWNVRHVFWIYDPIIFTVDVLLDSEYVSGYVSGYVSVSFHYFFHLEPIKFRSSRSQMSFKIDAFKTFAIFTGKHLY